jgi:hypothetical protein
MGNILQNGGPLTMHVTHLGPATNMLQHFEYRKYHKITLK